jgi:hypothetical protein
VNGLEVSVPASKFVTIFAGLITAQPSALHNLVAVWHVPLQQSASAVHVPKPVVIQQKPGVAPPEVQPVEPVGHWVQVLPTQHPHAPFTHTSPVAVLHAPQLATDEQALSVLGHLHAPLEQTWFGNVPLSVQSVQVPLSPHAVCVLGHIQLPVVLSQIWFGPVHAEHEPGPRFPLAQAPLLLGHVHAPLMQSGVAPVHAEQDPGAPQDPTVLSQTHW